MNSNADMDVCWLGAGREGRHGCALVGCGSAVDTWVCAGFVLSNNGNMGV